jgi:hypothetical protein
MKRLLILLVVLNFIWLAYIFLSGDDEEQQIDAELEQQAALKQANTLQLLKEMQVEVVQQEAATETPEPVEIQQAKLEPSEVKPVEVKQEEAKPVEVVPPAVKQVAVEKPATTETKIAMAPKSMPSAGKCYEIGPLKTMSVQLKHAQTWLKQRKVPVKQEVKIATSAGYKLFIPSLNSRVSAEAMLNTLNKGITKGSFIMEINRPIEQEDTGLFKSLEDRRRALKVVKEYMVVIGIYKTKSEVEKNQAKFMQYGIVTKIDEPESGPDSEFWLDAGNKTNKVSDEMLVNFLLENRGLPYKEQRCE